MWLSFHFAVEVCERKRSCIICGFFQGIPELVALKLMLATHSLVNLALVMMIVILPLYMHF